MSKPWRIALTLYALALTIGTHWPNLRLAPEVPATDKSIHLAAFAGLTVLLWRTRWFARRWIMGLILLLWAVLDELSQGIPILNRTVTWHDMLANALGVIAALTWLWALGPVGRTVNRIRLRRAEFLFEEFFATSRPWISIVLATVISTALVASLWVALEHVRDVLIMLGLLASVAITIILWIAPERRIRRQLEGRRNCLACGQIFREVAMRPEAWLTCSACGSPAAGWQWVGLTRPSIRFTIRQGLRPTILAGLVVAAAFILLFLAPILYDHWIRRGPGLRQSVAPRLVHMIGRLPVELTNTIDLALMLVLLALSVRIYRRGVGRFYDQCEVCIRCAHDLRGTPVDTQGLGRCGECGTPFARLIEPEPQRRRATERENKLR